MCGTTSVEPHCCTEADRSVPWTLGLGSYPEELLLTDGCGLHGGIPTVDLGLELPPGPQAQGTGFSLAGAPPHANQPVCCRSGSFGVAPHPDILSHRQGPVNRQGTGLDTCIDRGHFEIRACAGTAALDQALAEVPPEDFRHGCPTGGKEERTEDVPQGDFRHGRLACGVEQGILASCDASSGRRITLPRGLAERRILSPTTPNPELVQAQAQVRASCGRRILSPRGLVGQRILSPSTLDPISARPQVPCRRSAWLGIGCWGLDTGYWMLGIGFRSRTLGPRIHMGP